MLLDVALSPAFDRYADESLAMHMLQHVVVIAFVPPLVVLAAPWLTVWRAFPLDTRRSLAHAVLRLPAGVRRGLRALVTPVVAFGLITVLLAVWHVPALYDLTLRNVAVHDLEHASFLVFGILFWIPILDSPPLHPRLGYLGARALHGRGRRHRVAARARPRLRRDTLYPAYSALPRRLGGLSALADQQLAAGVMLGIGSIPYTVAVFVFVYRWLDEERPAVTRRTAFTTSPER